MISENQLLRGKNIIMDGVGTLVHPTLDKIYSSEKIGSDSFQEYLVNLSILQTTLEDFLEKTNLYTTYLQFSEEEKEQYTLFTFLILEPNMREFLRKALSFFIEEKIEFNAEKLCFMVGDNGVIDKDNFEELRTNILRLCCIEFTSSKQLKFKSEKSRRIWEKCQAGRQAMAKAKAKNGDKDIRKTFHNWITYITTRSNSYNLFNVWGLTVYQFYQVFHRTSLYVQLDTYSQRWAAWGKDKFDFSEYYKDIEIFKNGG